MRIPRDDLRLALAHDRQRAAAKIALAAVFRLLCRQARGLMRGGPAPPTADRVYGNFQSGRMTAGYVTAVLGRLDTPTAEIYFHPSLAVEDAPFGPNPGDLAALRSPQVRRAILERAITPAAYASLPQRSV